MQQCSQTKIRRGFTLIIDDSGHRKSGKSTAGVGRQYIGVLGKTDNGVVLVTTHLYDGVKSLPLDVSLYQHASSLVRIQVFDWGTREGMKKLQEWADIALRKKAIALLP